MNLLFSFLGLLCGVFCLILALTALIFGKTKIHRILTFFNISVAIWGLGYFIVGRSSLESNALFGWRFSQVGGNFIAVFFYHIVSLFCGLRRKISLITIYIWGAFFLFFCFVTDLLFAKTRLVYNIYYNDATWFYKILMFSWVVVICLSFIELLRFLPKASGTKRTQTVYIIFGFLCGFSGGTTTLLPMLGINFPPYGHITIPIYCIILTYAILRYRLMDIRVAISSFTIFGVVYALVLGVPFGLGYKLFGSWGTWLAPFALLAILATSGPSIYFHFQRRAEDRILQEDRRAQDLLTKASEGMTTIRNLKKLLGLTTRLITKHMKAKNASIYLLDNQTNAYVLKTADYSKDKAESLNKENDVLIQRLNDKKTSLVYDELKMEAQQGGDDKPDPVVEVMRKINAAVVIPSFIEDFLIGFLVLGQRRDDRIYTQENLNVLQVLANQAALAIENAIFFEERGKTLAETFHESRLRSIGTLGAGIGHQINNRFNAIAVPAQTISYKLKKKELDKLSPKELKELIVVSEAALDSIAGDALRGGKIATSLTSFSRKTEGHQPILFTKIMEEVLDLLSCKIKLAEIGLKQQILSDGHHLWGNLSQLEDVFFNLLDNAHDALKKKQAEAKEGNLKLKSNYKPRVRLKAIPTDSRLTITIEDNGIGMTKEQIEKLFIPFFTTKATAGKGTGLGLWIIKQIIEAHGGAIGVESKYGAGTKFIINLALATKEQIESHKEESLKNGA